MILQRTPRIVVLGMLTKMPVAGVIWQVIHYLEGLRRLGFEVTYVEAHSRTPSMFVAGPGDDGVDGATRYLDRVMRRFGLGDRWAFQALHADGRVVGMSASELQRVYGEAELILNLHGGTQPLEEHSAGDRLVFVGTDPVQLEVELFHENQSTIDFLDLHAHHFTFGENYGQPDCGLPVSDRYRLLPTRQPVVLDFWRGASPAAAGDVITTVGNWRQEVREIRLHGETYTWSKHDQFERVLDLPLRSGATLELALASCSAEERVRLQQSGWRVRDAAAISDDPDAYRDYIVRSAAEFTVAKDQNVRLRSGWFSDRSATYLAAGRPVITQDTGFGVALPTGTGLLAFDEADEAEEAVRRVRRDWSTHAQAASEIAREYFAHEVVLGGMLKEVGVSLPGVRAAAPPPDSLAAIPLELVLTPLSRSPIRLPEQTMRSLLDGTVRCALPDSSLGRCDDSMAHMVGHVPGRSSEHEPPAVSIVVVTHNQRALTRLCLASVFSNTSGVDYEVIVVDNASSDGTLDFLRVLAEGPIGERLRILANPDNAGFAAANNRGLSAARGDTLVLLNNDTIVPPGWLPRLVRHLEGGGVGAVGPVTNRIGNEAQISTDYETYGEMVELARRRAVEFGGDSFEISTLTMFCFALNRSVWQRVGPLDERFGIGMLEDDDYAVRVQRAGLRMLCAEDVFVHHFGQGSFGSLVESGEYATLLRANQARFADKWGKEWQPYARRVDPAYAALTARVRETVRRYLPESATVLVVSRGDEDLVKLGGNRRGWHMPRGEDGVFAGHYPADSGEAIAHLEALRQQGAEFLVVPSTSHWWLDFYDGLSDHLETVHTRLLREDDTCTIYALDGGSF